MCVATTKRIPRTPLVRVQLIRESSVTYPIGDVMSGPKQIAYAARAILDSYDREAFICAHLNSKHMLVSMEITALGTLNATLIHPREIYTGAILAKAAAICLIHNHPSGRSEPSSEDIALTRQLMQAGEIIGIRVIDHLILGSDNSTSLRETTDL